VLYLKGEHSILCKKRNSLKQWRKINQRNIEIQKCIEEEENKAAPNLLRKTSYVNAQ
jgi:hypothetical protein